MIATIFVHPVELSNVAAFWLLLPLLLVVAVVYKAVRSRDLGRLWIDLLGLMAYMVAGLAGLGAVLWLIHEYWP